MYHNNHIVSALIVVLGFWAPHPSSADVTFGSLWGGSPVYIPEAVTAPGFDPGAIFSDENSLVTLPNEVSAYELGEIPISQMLTWHQPRDLENYDPATTVHSISDLRLVVYLIASNGRYVVRLEGQSGPSALNAPSANTWVSIQIFDAPGDLVETAEVSFGTPKCGSVSSGVDQINSNPLLYVAEVRLRTLASGFLSGSTEC